MLIGPVGPDGKALAGFWLNSRRGAELGSKWLMGEVLKCE